MILGYNWCNSSNILYLGQKLHTLLIYVVFIATSSYNLLVKLQECWITDWNVIQCGSYESEVTRALKCPVFLR